QVKAIISWLNPQFPWTENLCNNYFKTFTTLERRVETYIMGNIVGTRPVVLSEEDRMQLDGDLERIQKNVWLTYKTHFTSSEYYGRIANGIDLFVNIIAPPSAAGLILSTRQSHLAAAGLSLMAIAFSGLQKYESSHSKFHPAMKQEQHFKAGIGLQAFHSELIAFRQQLRKDPSLTREKYLTEYRKIIDSKSRCDSIIQTEYWAYLRARKLIREIEKKISEET
ncbi:hypothetical protein AC249_AIPGENE28217, partial [Exaiptasia diaphana]